VSLLLAKQYVWFILTAVTRWNGVAAATLSRKNDALKQVRSKRLSSRRVLGGFAKCFPTFEKLQLFTNLGVGKNNTV
jgi:hypothetical protein